MAAGLSGRVKSSIILCRIRPKISKSLFMTPYQFGCKLAADTTAPNTPFGKRAPGLNPAGYDIKTDQQAKMWRNYGSPSGATLYTRAPKPVQPAKPPAPPNPEYERLRTQFSQQYPEFHPGEITDMVGLAARNDGSSLAKFIYNTRQRYKQNPKPVTPSVPPQTTPKP